MNKLLLSLALIFSAFTASANEELDMLSKLKSNFPAIPFTSVSKTPAQGIYEVTMGKDLLYVESSATFFFPTMVDMKNRVNLGDERRAELNKVNFSDLNVNDAIKTVNGNGSRKIAVFADPNCGYCKQLERNLTQLKDVTIYTFPVGILGQDSIAKAVSVSCAPKAEKSKIWQSMMLEGATPKSITCDNNPIQRNLALFQKFGFQGTPSIIYESGQQSKGFVENEKIESMLAKK